MDDVDCVCLTVRRLSLVTQRRGVAIIIILCPMPFVYYVLDGVLFMSLFPQDVYRVVN